MNVLDHRPSRCTAVDGNPVDVVRRRLIGEYHLPAVRGPGGPQRRHAPRQRGQRPAGKVVNPDLAAVFGGIGDDETPLVGGKT